MTDPVLPDLIDGFRVVIEGERADVILDRPPLNVITMPQREQLRAVFEALETDERVRIIVLRASGEHFSSGGEIRGFLEASPEYVSHLAWNIAAPARCRKPVIATSRGYCFGVGFELTLACDFRVVSETCLYALPEQRLGQIPGSGGAARLQKMVGIARTKDIVMRSRRLGGRQACEWGIATECVADSKLETTIDALVEELLGFPPLPSAPPRNCSTTPRTPACRSPSSSKAKPIASCAAPMISARASRPSTQSASQTIAEAEAARVSLARRRRCPAAALASPYSPGMWREDGLKMLRFARAKTRTSCQGRSGLEDLNQ